MHDHTELALSQNLSLAAGIRSIDWPSRSLDLNPIEHIWDVMGRAIHEQDPPPNLQQLGLRLIEVWNNIPEYHQGFNS